MRRAIAIAACLLGGAGVARGDGDAVKSRAAYDRGVKAYQEKQFVDASASFTEATQLDPGDHPAWYALGRVELEQQDPDDAVAAFQKAVALVPGEGMYQLELGDALHRDHRDADALVALTAAVAANPALFRAHYLIGQIDLDLGKPDDAAKSFTASIKSNPRFEFAWRQLAQLYVRNRYYDEALQVAKQGVENVAGSLEQAQLDYLVGEIDLAKQDDDGAIRAFSDALAAKKDFAIAQRQRAIAYAAKGDSKSASQDIATFLKVHGADPDLAIGRAGWKP